MVVGENNRDNDLNVNVCKNKKLTNVRSAGADDALNLTPVRKLTLEDALEYIGEDELVEITPKIYPAAQEDPRTRDAEVVAARRVEIAPRGWRN